jgi:hypothetical protein
MEDAVFTWAELVLDGRWWWMDGWMDGNERDMKEKRKGEKWRERKVRGTSSSNPYLLGVIEIWRPRNFD